jgi:exodeoxyribonuclease V beta subunit
MTSRPFDYRKHALSGQSVIESSAGTGKTYSIVQIYIRLVIERKLPPDKILVVTFTEAATAELKTRIRTALSELHASLAYGNTAKIPLLEGYEAAEFQSKDLAAFVESVLSSFDEAAIFTIHGFCRRVLRDHAFEYNSIFNADLVEDTEDLADGVTRDFIRKTLYAADEETVRLLQPVVQYDALRHLLDGFLSKTDVSLQPEKSDIEKIPALINQLHADHGKAAVKFNAEADQFFTLLKNKNAPLNRTRMKIEKIEKREPFIRQIFSRFDPHTADMEDVYLVCRTHIYESKLKKDEGIEQYAEHSCAVACDEYYTQYARVMREINESIQSFRAEFLRFAKSEMVIRKKYMNLWSFNDLIDNVREGLNGKRGQIIAEAIRRKYPAALIDEFQDTDPAQCDIFEKIFNAKSSLLFYIGDPKQAIYTFRGADVFSYISAKKDKDIYFKNENWRSVAPLVRSVNSIFSINDPFLLGDSVDYHEVHSRSEKRALVVENDSLQPMIVWHIESDKELKIGDAQKKVRTLIADEMARLLSLSEIGKTYFDDEKGHTPLKPGDCAVIVRQNSEAAAMRDVLRERGIPSVLAKSGSVYESPMKRASDLLFRAVTDRREQTIRAALSSELFQYTAAQIASFADDAAAWEQLLAKFRTMHTLWECNGFMAMFSHAVREMKILEAVSRYDDGARYAADLIHLAEIYHRTAIEKSLGPAELLSWILQCDTNSASSDEHRTRLETDDDAVRIVTVHSAKGLEYPVVFVACGWDFREAKKDDAVYYHDGDTIVCDLSVDPVDAGDIRVMRADIEQRAENMRLYYVALTRASHRCYAVTGRLKGYGKSAAGYLFHSHRVDETSKTEAARIERVQCVSSTISDLENEDLSADVRNAAIKGGFSVITVGEEPAEALTLRQKSSDPEKLEALTPKRDIRDDWKISSFSFIVSSLPDDWEDKADPDRPSSDAEEEPVFPKGAEAGNCIHEIFEKTDFSQHTAASLQKVIHESLRAYSLEGEGRTEWVAGMVDAVLDKKISIVGKSLRSLSEKALVKEMEFYFPAAEISARSFRETFLRHVDSSFNDGHVKNIEALDFEKFSGFLKGFIDLVFESNGRYHIIDWKSNWLGSAYEDYHHARICREMDRHCYTVQALVYALALHLHLTARYADYDYDKHFGGVAYLFIRGIEPDGDTGIWEWKPEKKLIDAMISLCVRRET